MGFLLKLARSQACLTDLQSRLNAWVAEGHYTSVTKPDPTAPDYIVVRVSADPVPLDPFSLLIGDVLHNLRGALDHLAYELAVKNTSPLPDDIARDSEFPIFGDKNRKGNLGVGPSLFYGARAKIRGMSTAAQTLIEGLQPYQRGKDYTSHPLWHLHELSNIDKHRLLLVSMFSSAGAALDTRQCVNVTIHGNIDVFGGFVEGETAVLRYGARPTDPSREMYVKFDPTLQITFRTGSVVDGKDVTGTLGAIYSYIVAEVVPPLSKFL